MSDVVKKMDNWFVKAVRAVWWVILGIFSEIKGGWISVEELGKGAVIKIIHLWDEKRFFGVVWLTLALTLSFLIPSTDLQILVSCAGLGVALFLGIPLGDSVPFLAGLKSLGLGDLFTNKANQGDPLRVFGFLFQVSAIVYVLTPLWKSGAQTNTETFLFLGGVGVALSWSAIWGDHAAVQGQGQ